MFIRQIVQLGSDAACTVPTTLHPLFKNSTAIARPRPRDAPTKCTCLSVMGASSALHGHETDGTSAHEAMIAAQN
jgi:hypothetical protein